MGYPAAGCRHHVAAVEAALQGSVQAVMCNLAALAHDCTGQNIAEAGDRDADMRTVGQEVADRRNWVEVKVGLAGDRHDILAAAMV